jgi:putative transposase
MAHLKRLEQIFRSVCADFAVVLKEFNGEPDHVAPIGQLPAKGPSFRAGEQPQRRLLAPHETGIPSHLDVLEYQKKSRRIVVGQLVCGSVGEERLSQAPISILRQYIEKQNRPPTALNPRLKAGVRRSL